MRDLSLDVRGDGPDGGLSILSDDVGINTVVNHAGSEGMDIQSDRQNGSGHMTYKLEKIANIYYFPNLDISVYYF